MRQLQPTMTPTGWFQIAWSSDLPVGGVKPLRYFGRDLVAYRGEDGVVRVLDGHCRHLGGHLGYGGTVSGDCVVCPFHGWHWNGEGRNTHIPYQEGRPNEARRLTAWPVIEQDECVYLWHDVLGREPDHGVPHIFTDVAEHIRDLEFRPASPRGLVRYDDLTLTPQMVAENAADPVHFRFVHATRHAPVALSQRSDEHTWFIQIGFGRRWVEWDPTSHDGDTLAILQGGIGLSFTALSGADNTAILLATTPIDDRTCTMFQTVWLERLDGDEEPGVLERRMEVATAQLKNDIVIWSHQVYEDPPALATSEGRLFGDLRRWSERWYPEQHAPARQPAAAQA